MKKDTKTTVKEAAAKAESAVKEVAAKADTAAKATAAKAESAAKEVAAKADTAAKKAVAKADTAAKKAAAKKPAAKKPAAKKAAPKAPVVNTVLQLGGKEITVAEMVEQAKANWTGSEVKEVNLYIKPEDNRVYVVVNGEEAGSIEL
ncbi:MAG: hypothetical protein IJ112_00035 [Oscillospiraceae bacterium]|nr:hypothetical protein [Oscillospiraceae bacterium]